MQCFSYHKVSSAEVNRFDELSASITTARRGARYARTIATRVCKSRGAVCKIYKPRARETRDMRGQRVSVYREDVDMKNGPGRVLPRARARARPYIHTRIRLRGT